MVDDFGVQLSEDDSDEENLNHCQRSPPELQGTLCKWTNYIHGWQNRYIVLHDGTMSYYKNENETSFGCRGSISVQKAVIKPHEIDENRFDVCLNDCVWYLRTTTPEEKHQWVDALELHKENNLRRYGSALSLTSTSFSTTSGSSLKKTKGLKEKLAEIETYRDIVVKQMETLQTYFDSCAEVSKEFKYSEKSCNGMEIQPEVVEEAVEAGTHLNPLGSSPISRELIGKHASHSIDFRGEALTFKATTAGILTTLSHCVEVMNQREETFRRRLEREVEKRRKLEEKIKACMSQTSLENQQTTKYVVVGGPDYEEGPHSVIGEDEFFDAVESALDKMEEEEEFRERLRQKQRSTPMKPGNTHPLWPQIDSLTEEQLEYAQQDVEGGIWQLFTEEGEMKMYKREVEEDGLVVDPLKAVHQVRGVTAHEMSHHFWSPDVRTDWDTTIEQMNVLDRISTDTLVFLQVHKRVWPTAQRDALFWSHIRKIDDNHVANKGAHDTWIVCNRSTEHTDDPKDDKCVRVDLVVSFVCQTLIDPPVEEGQPISRENLLCKITYCSIVNPGGWAPASVLRAVYKREYPKFLRRFTQYVIDKCRDQPIAFTGLTIKDDEE